jgi:hypothetical protein
VAWHQPLVESADEPVDGHAFSLLSHPNHDPVAMRYWSDSYLALTRAGHPERWKDSILGQPNRLVSWITAQSAPPMLAPSSAGSRKSGLYEMLEEGHAGLRLTQEELDKIACWIDLGVPYCGDYLEASAWPDKAKAEYAYYQHKRDRMAAIERDNIEMFSAGRRKTHRMDHVRRRRSDRQDRLHQAVSGARGARPMSGGAATPGASGQRHRRRRDRSLQPMAG